MTTTDFHVFDTTLRDGAQREGISFSVADKLAVARLLDEIGVGYIEGGWPGALPKDTEFFARARTELKLRHAVLVAFGATRKAGVTVACTRWLGLNHGFYSWTGKVDHATAAMREATGWLREVFAGRPPSWETRHR